MKGEIHKCSYGNFEEISVIERDLKSRGFVESAQGQSQEDILPGEYVKVSFANVRHHRHGELQYRIAWVEAGE
ncbi:MAG: hypothetical protein Q9M30_05640 [Mariprofundaceae bacterium]|nr:hypothetical protein [Mariprofundaceae bacterium]